MNFSQSMYPTNITSFIELLVGFGSLKCMQKWGGGGGLKLKLKFLYVIYTFGKCGIL